MNGAAMYELARELYPICRSITGDGTRQTLRRLQQEMALDLVEVPTGTQVFDWTVPREWNVRDAYVKNNRGERVIDFRRHNLHVVNYSIAVHRTMSLAELRPHLHSLPDHPDWIPYRTTYYAENWGFCLAHRDLERLTEGDYEVCIDSTLAPGALTYGEFILRGDLADEVLLSCHTCHPSLANDNLSGLVVAAALAQALSAQPRRLTYRFLFIPGTIGSITWLAENSDIASRIRHGLVLSCIGDSGRFTYKRSRRGSAVIDRAVAHVLSRSGRAHDVRDFVPYGYDERQYCSPGFDLPVGCFMRTPNGEFPEYHTSADNLDLISAEALEASLGILLQIVEVLEADETFVNLNPHCEPQLGRRGLYRNAGGTELPNDELALLWVLNFSDSAHSLLDIAEQSQLPFRAIRRAAHDLVNACLLARAPLSGLHLQRSSSLPLETQWVSP